MQNSKPLSFSASAGSYFVLSIVSIIGAYIPFLGWAFILNFTADWFANHALVNGQKVRYQAGYGESLKFVFINFLLIVITLGIYSFWFYPKAYKYVADHVSYDDVTPAPIAAAPAEPATPAPAAPEIPSGIPTPVVDPTPPAGPTSPIG